LAAASAAATIIIVAASTPACFRTHATRLRTAHAAAVIVVVASTAPATTATFIARRDPAVLVAVLVAAIAATATALTASVVIILPSRAAAHATDLLVELASVRAGSRFAAHTAGFASAHPPTDIVIVTFAVLGHDRRDRRHLLVPSGLQRRADPLRIGSYRPDHHRHRGLDPGRRRYDRRRRAPGGLPRPCDPLRIGSSCPSGYALGCRRHPM